MDKRGTMSAFPNAGMSRGEEFWVTAGVAALVFVVASTGVSAKESSGGSELPSSSNSASPFQEERPPVGKSNLFSEAQIRYCLSQIIRIQAVRTLVDRYRKAQVQYFNEL